MILQVMNFSGRFFGPLWPSFDSPPCAYLWVPFRVLSIGVPCYIWDLTRDPSLENYPCSVPKVRRNRFCFGLADLSLCWRIRAYTL